MKNCKPIMLVEDDDVDAMTVRRAFKDLNVQNKLVHSVNGEEALKYLKDTENEMPCVILLDLNMPKMNGTDFLTAIKADAELRQIPIIVMTVSNNEADKDKCFELCAAGYVVKPANYDELITAIKTLDAYWTLSELPFPDV